jgi:hypothetical protein
MPVPQDEYRHCSNCRLRWKLWHFEPFPDDPPEVEGWCQSCRRTERYVRNAGIERKRCGHCGELKPLEEFSPHQDTRDGLDAWCKACHASPTRALDRSQLA